MLYDSLMSFVAEMGLSMNEGLLFLYFAAWTHCFIVVGLLPRIGKLVRMLYQRWKSRKD